MNTSRGEAERWLAWLDGDRKDDGTRPMVGTPYQTAQRIAKRLHEGERDRIRAIQELGAMARGEDPDEDSWRDYDHGFRDGYQAARREIAGPRYGTGGVIGTGMTDMSQSDSPYFDGRMLDGALTLVLLPDAETPGAGYAVTIFDGKLWRNGEFVAVVKALTFDRDALGWWVDYTSWRGSPMDTVVTR